MIWDMSQSEFARLPALELPAPLGVGVGLGLIDRVHQSHEAEPGTRLRVEQVRGLDSDRFARALAGLTDSIHARGGQLFDRVSACDLVDAGTVGVVVVHSCRQLSPGNWVWRLASPRMIDKTARPETGGAPDPPAPAPGRAALHGAAA